MDIFQEIQFSSDVQLVRVVCVKVIERGGWNCQLGHAAWYPKIREDHIGRHVFTLM